MNPTPTYPGENIEDSCDFLRAGIDDVEPLLQIAENDEYNYGLRYEALKQVLKNIRASVDDAEKTLDNKATVKVFTCAQNFTIHSDGSVTIDADEEGDE